MRPRRMRPRRTRPHAIGPAPPPERAGRRTRSVCVKESTTANRRCAAPGFPRARASCPGASRAMRGAHRARRRVRGRATRSAARKRIAVARSSGAWAVLASPCTHAPHASRCRAPSVRARPRWYQSTYVAIDSPQAMRAEMQQRQRAGLDFIKVYTRLSRAVFLAAVQRQLRSRRPATRWRTVARGHRRR